MKKMKTVKAWAIVAATGLYVEEGRTDQDVPALFDNERTAKSFAWSDQRVVRVEIREIPRGGKKR